MLESFVPAQFANCDMMWWGEAVLYSRDMTSIKDANSPISKTFFRMWCSLTGKPFCFIAVHLYSLQTWRGNENDIGSVPARQNFHLEAIQLISKG